MPIPKLTTIADLKNGDNVSMSRITTNGLQQNQQSDGGKTGHSTEKDKADLIKYIKLSKAYLLKGKIN
ncbi:hypothetical protein DPMN_135961 [Dreissena polymorpha]|uniref:Uncharacterized protein n=1 Tax=Dreissena polymorpha TaxID=45954 RepID=A0A9D4G2X8_DREPO|nr:hypothetical protein DPMN_135961 [Dreissena polymorpha]